jgi:hypothetical protein
VTADDLITAFRSDVGDEVAPYLWSDTEVWRYLNDAYRMFARLTGGIPATLTFDIVAGEQTTEVSPKILRFREARLTSTGRKLTIINPSDEALGTTADYGQARAYYVNRTQGPVSYMIIGDWRNRLTGVVGWAQIPAVNDTAEVSVYRLPLGTLTSGSELSDVGEEHHEHLMLWMKYIAHGKQDAETFDRGRRDEYKQDFETYCARSKAEWDRYKHKTRVVTYGGI